MPKKPYTYPVILCQLLIRPPSADADRADYWMRLRGETTQCAETAYVKAGGEPKDMSLSRSYLDYLLLMPEGYGTPGMAEVPTLIATVIDAKAYIQPKVKLGI